MTPQPSNPRPLPVLAPAPWLRPCKRALPSWQAREHAGHEGNVTQQPSNPRPLPCCMAPAPLADARRACGASVLQGRKHAGHGRPVTATALEPAPSPCWRRLHWPDARRACDASVLQDGGHAGHERPVTQQPSNPRPLPCWHRLHWPDALRACGASVLQEGEHAGHGRSVTATALEPAPSPLLAPAPHWLTPGVRVMPRVLQVREHEGDERRVSNSPRTRALSLLVPAPLADAGVRAMPPCCRDANMKGMKAS